MSGNILDNMRRETTQQAKKCIQSHSELKRILESIRNIYNTDPMETIDNLASQLSNECTRWAEEHNEEFGELFISELPLVYWEKLVGEQ